MSKKLSPEDMNQIQSVISNSELRSVEFFEVSASRSVIQPDFQGPGSITVEAQQRIGDTGFGIKLSAKLTLPHGEAKVTVVGEYSLNEGFTPERKAVQLFANEVAIMTVLPYLREGIATVTTKVFGSPVFFPLLQRGEISLDVDD